MKLDNIRLFYAFNFFLYFRPYWPIAIIYYQQITGSYAIATAVFSIVFISQSLLELPTGLFSDYLGRKKTLIIGALFSCLALLFYALGFNFWVLAFGALCEGMSRSLFSGTKNALLYESLKEEGRVEEYDRVLGRSTSTLQVGLALSALLGSLLALHSLSLVVWVSVIPQFLCFAVCFKFAEPKYIERSEDHLLLMIKAALQQFKHNSKLCLTGFAEAIEFGFGEAMFYFQGAFYKMVIPEWMIGIVKALNHFCSAIGAWHAAAVLKKFGYKKSLIGGGVVVAVVDFLALAFPSVLSPFIMASTALNYGVADTARNSLMQRDFTDHQRATMDSMVSFMSSVMFATVSYALGYVADLTNPAFALMAGLSGNVIAILLYTRVFRK